jgi:DMSO/TMAO reductase YedYZ molybdopterin-dependent catalytic subunit
VSEIGGGYRRASSVVVGLFSGLTAALIMILVMALLRWGLGIPTPWELVGDRLAPTFDAGEFLGLLQRFGGYNQLKQLGVGSVLGAQTVVALIGGLVFAAVEGKSLKKDSGALLRIGATRRGLLFVTAIVLVFWIASLVTLWPVLNTSFSGLPYTQAAIATAAGTLVSYCAYGLALVGVHRFITGSPVFAATESSGQRVIKRRMFLSAGAMAAAAAAAFGALSRLYHLATFDYDGTQYIGEDVHAITPNDRFYTVTKNVIDPAVYAPLWRLEVMGMVESPRVYTFDDVKALSGFNQETTLMCISNWVGGGLMSNAVWKGVPLRSLIESAGPRQGAIEVFFRAADGYTDSISIEKALEPTTIVAYEMNGEPLPQRHGYPVRIVVPGLFGEKNVKWVTRIEVVDHDAKGFYETQGWGPNFVVPTRSRFDFPYYDQTASFASPIVLKGVAFGGDRGVSRVEVSVDGAKTWRDASVEYAGTRLTWTLWTYQWEPPGSGEFQLVVRATDGSGATQTAEDRGTVPEGATGYHRVTLRLED